MYKRDVTNKITDRLKEERRFIQVIVGPRQVGKTTAIYQVLEETEIPSHYAAADLPAPPDTRWISQQWDLARLKLQSNYSVILVLDEVQKVAHWSNEVKRLWDEDTRLGNNIHVVLLGSSSLLIQKGLDESLAGRFEIIRFPHWRWEECRDCFQWSLDKYIYFGGYPGTVALVEDESRWSQYIRDSLIETALSKDILLLNRVEKQALLRQLFVLSCDYGGQILSYQKIMGQLADSGNTTTIAHYQKLLESAFLIRGLPKWSGKMFRRRSSSPKWLPLNTALMTALANRSFEEWRNNPESWGRLVEVTVGAHLVNIGWGEGIEIYYWRQGHREVDFILCKGNKVVAIEVKSGKKRTSLPGLVEFSRQYSVKRTLTVGGADLSIKEFLETPLQRWIGK